MREHSITIRMGAAHSDMQFFSGRRHPLPEVDSGRGRELRKLMCRVLETRRKISLANKELRNGTH